MVVDWVMRVVCLESNVWIGMLMSRMTTAPLSMWQKVSASGQRVHEQTWANANPNPHLWPL